MTDQYPLPLPPAAPEAARPDPPPRAPDGRMGRGIPLGFVQADDRGTPVGFARPSARKTTRKRRKLLTDDTERHVLLVAPTGAGKGRNFIIPTLLHCADPAVVVDIKGELANTTAEYRAGIGHQIAIIDPWRLTRPELGRYRTGYNPLAVLDPDSPTFADDCFALAGLLCPPGGLLHDPYWNERAESVIAGVMALVRSEPHIGEAPADRTMGAVHRHLNNDDVAYGLAVKLDTVGKQIHPFARHQIAAFLGVSAEPTRVGIVSTFQSLMRCFASDAVKASLADGLDPLAVADGSPLTVYLVMPPDKLHSHAALLRLWIASLMGHITQRRTRPERRTLFVIDEAAQLGPLPQLRTAVTLARGYGLRAIIVLQSPAQLRATFESDWEVFLENCGVVMTFGVDRPGMAQTMASWLGDIAPETLARLQSTQLAVRQGDAQTVVLGRIDMLKDRPFKDRLGANPMFATQGGRR